MEFAEPLALLLAILALPVALLARRRSAGYTVPATGAVATLPASWRVRAARALPILRVLAVVLLAVAVAGPREGNADTVVPGEGVDIALALDVSSSMDERFSAQRPSNDPTSSGTTRLEATLEVVREFIRSRQDDRVGLVIFAEEALALSPPSLDYEALDRMLLDMDPRVLPDGTGIGVGLGSAINMLQGSTAASRVVILLTDGEHNANSISPEKAAELAVSLKIRVYTIGVVSRVSPGLNEGIDEELLRAIADRTGATYFEADSPQALQDVYTEIGSLERSRIGRASFERFTEWAPWFAGSAAALVALELLLRGTVLRRSPA